MAILVNVYQDKRKSGNNLWYGRALHPATIDTKALSERIEQNVSVKAADVYAVLIELANVMSYELSNGNKVQLDNFGYFAYGVRSRGALTSKEWNVIDHVKGFGINFQLFNTRNSEGKVTSKSLNGNALRAEVYARDGKLVSTIKDTPTP